MNNQDKATVLIVEDEVFVRMIAADILAEEGFVILEAATAEEALAQLARNPNVAVLFTDVNMPGPINGLQLADMVATDYPEVRVIVTSGRERLTNSELPARGMFLPKPYSTQRLSEVMHMQVKS